MEFKVLLLGGKGVGKSSIFNRLSNLIFQRKYIPTKHVSESEIIIPLTNNENATIRLMDIPSHLIEANYSILSDLFLHIEGIIFVIDSMNTGSYKDIEEWNNIAMRYSPIGVPKVMAVHKVDGADISDIRIEDVDSFSVHENISSWHFTVGSPELIDADMRRGLWHKQSSPESVLQGLLRIILRDKGNTHDSPKMPLPNSRISIKNIKTITINHINSHESILDIS